MTAPSVLQPLRGIPPQIFLISQTPYGYLHHRSQRIADQLHDWGVPVTYVEESGGWRPYITGRRKGLLRAIGRSFVYHLLTLTGLRFRRRRIEARGQGMDVVEMPLSIPTTRFDSAPLERWTAALFRTVLEREIFPRRDPRLASVALVNSPIWGLALRKGDFGRIVYDCIDDVSLYAGLASPERFLSYERQLLQVADAAIATAASLETHIRAVEPRVPIARIPNGVDAEHFQESAADGRTLPDIDAFPAPIVGYVGTISGWLNIPLAAETATLLPGVTFLFVGPEDPWVDLAPLKRLPNVRFLGRRPYADVPSIIGACRVCWIPFSSGTIVERTNPIKLFEYFALGKPVVSTPMPELEPYHQAGLLGFGRTGPELVLAIESALAEKGTDLAARRASVARDHSWEMLIEELLGILAPVSAAGAENRR